MPYATNARVFHVPSLLSTMVYKQGLLLMQLPDVSSSFEASLTERGLCPCLAPGHLLHGVIPPYLPRKTAR